MTATFRARVAGEEDQEVRRVLDALLHRRCRAVRHLVVVPDLLAALPQQEGSVGGSADDASPAGGRSRSRGPSDAVAAPPPPADPSGAALPRMMGGDSEPGSMDEDDPEHTPQC